MSSCCCLQSPCPVKKTLRSPFGGGTHANKGEGTQLVLATSGDMGDYPEYSTSRTEMDIALLREQYKWTKEKQMRQNRVVIFRRVSEDLTEAVRIIPVTQGLSSTLWETNNSGPPDLTLLPVDPTSMTPDPWHVHLDLHRRTSTPAVTLTLTTPTPARTRNIAGSHWPPVHRRHSSLSEAGSLKADNEVERYSVGSAAAFNGSCPNIPLKAPRHGHSAAGGRRLDGLLKIPPREEFTGDSLTSASEGCSFAGSLTSFEEGYAPGGYSLTPSACSSVADPGEAGEPPDGSYGLACHALGRLAVPAPSAPARHQRSGAPRHAPSLLPEQQQHPDYYPFPNRKSIKKSEAAKKLGMYSSF